MANQLKMADVQAILALLQRGWSYRQIARELDVDRDTVRRYAQRALNAGADPANAFTGSDGQGGATTESTSGNALTGSDEQPGAITEPNPAMALTGSDEPTGPADPNPAMALTGSEGCGVPLSAVTEARAVPLAGASLEDDEALSDPRIHLSAAWPWREAIVQKLEQGLDAQRIYQDLRTDHGYAGSYHSVRRLARKLKAHTPLPVRRMECAPGVEAQVDFGKGAPLVGPDGRRRRSWVIRIVLSHSRKGYSEAVVHQKTDDFLRCLENGFTHFGGASQTLVIDNLRAAVKRADWFDPELCPKVRSFAQHYGIAILPTRPYTPRHKGKVENGVKYVKGNALKGLTFPSLAEENRHLAQWESAVADTRIHGTTRRQVIGQFLQVEKPALLPLPPARFDLFAEALRTVHRDGHVQVQGAYYSLPPEYLGQEVWARWDGRTVRLFDRKMQPIAVHAQKPPGAFSTVAAHIHPHKINGIERGAAWLLGQVDRIGPQAQAWAQAMLRERGIEGVRVLMGLLNLSQKHPAREVERACQIAAGHGAWHLRSLRQLIQQHAPVPIQQSFEFLQQHPIIRGLGEYAQFVREALHGPLSSNPKECST